MLWARSCTACSLAVRRFRRRRRWTRSCRSSAKTRCRRASSTRPCLPTWKRSRSSACRRSRRNDMNRHRPWPKTWAAGCGVSRSWLGRSGASRRPRSGAAAIPRSQRWRRAWLPRWCWARRCRPFSPSDRAGTRRKRSPTWAWPTARPTAPREKRLADRRLYVAEMNLAQQAWEEGDIPLLAEHLASQKPGRSVVTPTCADSSGTIWTACSRAICGRFAETRPVPDRRLQSRRPHDRRRRPTTR